MRARVRTLAHRNAPDVRDRTAIGQPVRNASDKVVALLQCVNKLEAGVEPYEPSERPCFDEADSAYLEHVAALITLAVKNASMNIHAEQALENTVAKVGRAGGTRGSRTPRVRQAGRSFG